MGSGKRPVLRALLMSLILLVSVATHVMADTSLARRHAEDAGVTVFYDFVDYEMQFRLLIPFDWVFAAEDSDDGLWLFYGPGEHDLAFVEVFEIPPDRVDLLELGGGLIELYEEHMVGFGLIAGPAVMGIGGKPGLMLAYRLSDSSGIDKVRVESLMLIGRVAYSVTVEDSAAAFMHSISRFEVMMSSFSPLPRERGIILDLIGPGK